MSIRAACLLALTTVTPALADMPVCSGDHRAKRHFTGIYGGDTR